ncbi:recombinase family protein [Microtetraspora sp. AC03309]|uniref:recombinase family protein n=1 Tax=Microtetraspora sp. AC03309 TaxID=2779376 RepID=UPI001E361398|nr:recombinase family protein [Microtetraspora sp. AC03309]MCC5580058.1 recombinase family protein [Microtetraspora sp. AC03309]
MQISKIRVQRIDGPRELADYARKSQDRDGTEHGVSSQHLENQDFADDQELGEITRTYSDNDISARDEDAYRPDYERLLVDMSTGQVGKLIIFDATRLHRRVDQAHAFIRHALTYDVRLYSRARGGEYNFKTAAGRADFIRDTVNAEQESDLKGERVALARKRQARNGDYGGGVRPYGWGVDTGRVRSVCINPKAPTMERQYENRPVLDMGQHNTEEAEEITSWKSDLLSGVPMNQVLRSLAERGVLTVSQKDARKLRRDGKTVEAKGWNSKTVQQILTHPRTAGHQVYRGEIIRKNALPAIITEDERQALIDLFTDPKRRTAPGNTPKWLVSLIMKCPVCNDGTTMTVRNNSQGLPIYRCRAGGHCSTPAEETDRWVEAVMIERLSRPDLADLLPQRATVDVAALRAEVIAIEARKKNAGKMYARGGIDEETFQETCEEADRLVSGINEQLKAATGESPLAVFLTSDDTAATWASLSRGRKREIITLLATVTAVPIGRGRRKSLPPINERVIIDPVTPYATA